MMNVYTAVMQYVTNKRRGSHYCEEVLGDKGIVRTMGAFFRQNKSTFEYLNILQNAYLKISLYDFLELCEKESELYAIEDEKKRNHEELKAKEEARKQARKKAF